MSNATDSPIGKRFRVRKLERYPGGYWVQELMDPMIGCIYRCEDVTDDNDIIVNHNGINFLMNPDWLEPVADEPSTPEDNVVKNVSAPSKYHRAIDSKDGYSDVYDIARAYGIVDHAQFHALKKILLPGVRGAKSAKQDCEEAIQSIKRMEVMQ